jgi:hypothetical protein
MRKILTLLLTALLVGCLNATPTLVVVNITIDLKSKSALVEYQYAQPMPQEPQFKMPPTLPGTYHPIDNTGIGDITFDDTRLSYTVDLSVTSNVSTQDVLAKRSIALDGVVVLNMNALIGYIDNQTDYSYEINITGLDSYQCISHANKTDGSVYGIQFENYEQAATTPLIFAEHYTLSTLKLPNFDVHIVVFSPTGIMDSDYITEVVGSTAQAAFSELNFLNRQDDYYLTFIFNSEISINVAQSAALEHSDSAIFYL